MTIGELLKTYREALGLTQKEMAGEVLTGSYYAKLEKDQHRIAGEDLLQILMQHGISLDDFGGQLYQGKKLATAEEVCQFLRQHLDEEILVDNKRFIQTTSDDLEDLDFWLLLSQVVNDAIQGQALDLRESDIQHLVDYFQEKEGWDYLDLVCFSTLFDVLTLAQNQLLIDQMLKASQFDSLNSKERTLFLTLQINFVSAALMENRDDLAAWYIQQVNEFPARTDTFFQSTLALYFKHLINYRQSTSEEDLKQILAVMELIEETGFVQFAETLRYYFQSCRKKES